MNAKLFGAALICTLLGTACATRPAGGPDSLENRITMNAVLEEPVGTKLNKAGDRVRANLVEPVTTHDGTLIPRNSKLLGRVTYVRAANAGEYQSILGVVFDRALLEGGQEIPLNASVRAIAVARFPVAARGAEKPGGTATPRANSAAGAVGDRFGGGRRVIFNQAKTARPAAKVVERSFPKSPGAVGGLDSNGLLISQSRGVFGFPGMNMNERSDAGTKTTLISAILSDVKLDSGTRILLSVDEHAKLESGAHSGAMN